MKGYAETSRTEAGQEVRQNVLGERVSGLGLNFFVKCLGHPFPVVLSRGKVDLVCTPLTLRAAYTRLLS